MVRGALIRAGFWFTALRVSALSLFSAAFRGIVFRVSVGNDSSLIFLWSELAFGAGEALLLFSFEG